MLVCCFLLLAQRTVCISVPDMRQTVGAVDVTAGWEIHDGGKEMRGLGVAHVAERGGEVTAAVAVIVTATTIGHSHRTCSCGSRSRILSLCVVVVHPGDPRRGCRCKDEYR